MALAIKAGDDVVIKYNDAPLGADDAFRRNDVSEVFVDVRSLIRQVNVTSDDIRSIKTVVGKKGSGKTHILKHIENSSGAERDVVYCTLNDNNVPIRLENQLSDLHDLPNFRTKWSKFWRIVINLSILSKFTAVTANHAQKLAAMNFVNHKRISDSFRNVSEWKSIKSILVSYFIDQYQGNESIISEQLIDKFCLPTTIMHDILQKIRAVGTMDTFIDSIDIDKFDDDLASLAKYYKPIHMIIDGIDDVSWKHPRVWLDFQVGLFDASFNFSNISRASSQICLTVAIRNYVYLHALKTPHADRYDGLLSLNWDPDSARTFLKRRLQQVAGGNFVDSHTLTDEGSLAHWLGFDHITATRRNDKEDVVTYFLRHTRLSPRHIIKFFNTMCMEKNRLKNLDNFRNFGMDEFRTLVAARSLEVADTMLRTAAEEILALVPEISDRDTRNNRPDGLLHWVSATLEDIICDLDKEVVDYELFSGAISICVDSLLGQSKLDVERLSECKSEVESILWRSNVFAYWDNRRLASKWVFSWSPRYDLKPRRSPRIGFHSSLIDKCELEVSEHGPVF